MFDDTFRVLYGCVLSELRLPEHPESCQGRVSHRKSHSIIVEVPYTQTNAWIMAALANVVGQVNG